MISRSLRRRVILSSTIVLGITAFTTFFLPQPPSQALPVYSRRYGVTCEACHTTAPALNAVGQAFQANHFNWVGGPPKQHSGLEAIPLSGLATYASFDNLTNRTTSSGFQTLQIFLTDGFRLGGANNGGYFIDDFAYVKGEQGGVLGNAFASVPLAGPRGQLSVTAGQFAPMMYQYDPINSLTQSLPSTLENAVDGFSFADAHPGARLDYFSNQGKGTANGDYVDIGVPFRGLLAINDESDVDGPGGVYLHAFHRTTDSSLGVFGFDGAGHYIAGAIGTYQWRGNLYLLGAGQVSQDQLGHAQIASIEANYIASSQFALTARLESMAGEESATFPVFGVTYYPFRPQVIRFAAETTQERANRSTSFFMFGQF